MADFEVPAGFPPGFGESLRKWIEEMRELDSKSPILANIEADIEALLARSLAQYWSYLRAYLNDDPTFEALFQAAYSHRPQFDLHKDIGFGTIAAKYEEIAKQADKLSKLLEDNFYIDKNLNNMLDQCLTKALAMPTSPLQARLRADLGHPDSPLRGGLPRLSTVLTELKALAVKDGFNLGRRSYDYVPRKVESETAWRTMGIRLMGDIIDEVKQPDSQCFEAIAHILFALDPKQKNLSPDNVRKIWQEYKKQAA